MPVWTIGHSAAELGQLVTLLRAQHVDALIDVRSSPYSRHVPQANRDVLEAAAADAGLRYVFMGDSLGGRPKGLAPPDGDKPDYACIAQSEAFRAGIDSLVGMAQGAERICILCSEEDPARCHRGNLISPMLVALGVPVIHIRHDSTTETQQEMELRQSGGQLSLF